MITIAQDGDLVTLINVFSCEPHNQQRLIDAWIHATEERRREWRSETATRDPNQCGADYLFCARRGRLDDSIPPSWR